MRKVVYSLTNSLDNFIARTDGGADWILMDDELMNEFPKFFEMYDTVLMGRKTYDVSYAQSQNEEASQDESGFMGMKTCVFSRTMKESPGAEVEVVSEDAGEFVRNLKHQSGKDIWLMGGGNLAASLLKENLIDEIGLAIQPVLLGSGIPLFPEIGRQFDLQLIESKTYKNGTVSVTYRIKS
ncbi:MAG: dihydrofolate reductase family protein [Anaerolineae bacterium]|nr:dihydrofolate reductase family protein [Anaerolineae bacterium]